MFIINIEPTPFVVFLHMYMNKSSNKSFYLAIAEGTEPLLLITKYHIWLGGIFQFHMMNLSLGILISLVNASLIKRDTVNLLTLPSVIYKIILLKPFGLRTQVHWRWYEIDVCVRDWQNYAGQQVFHQSLWIPMASNCAPWLADLHVLL